MEQFKQTLGEKIGMLRSTGRPSQTLLIQLGLADKEALASALSRRPPDSMMLYLHPPCPGRLSQELDMLASKSPMVVAPLDCSASLRQLLFSIVASINAQDVKMGAPSEMSPQRSKETQWLCKAIDDSFANMRNLSRSSHIRLRCALANLPSIASGSRLSMPCASPSSLALVCGAGPSLQSQFELIREFRSRISLICVGRAEKALSDAGLTPDFVVEVDPHAWLNWPVLRKCASTLVAPECVAPVVAECFERIVWCDSRTSYMSGFLSAAGIKLPELSVSGSVAVSAVDLAIAMGFRRIALAGCELALSSSGDSHLSGGDFKDESPELLLEVPGLDGGLVKTTRTFDAIRRDFEEYIELIPKRPGFSGKLEIFNCSLSGALINGAARADLRRLLEAEREAPKLEAASTAKPEGLPSCVCSAIEGTGKALRAMDAIGESLKRLLSELSSGRPRPEKLANSERALMDLFKEESSLRASGSASHFLAAAFSLANQIFDQAAPNPQGKADPRMAHYKSMRERCEMQGALLRDLRSDLVKVESSMRQGTPAGIDPYIHPAFRAFALLRIRQTNKELAGQLAKLPLGAKPGFLDLRPKGQDIPIILSMSGKDGAKLRLDSLLGFAESAVNGVNFFLEKSAFNAQRHAVIFAGHVNWGMIAELAHRSKDLDCAIVEPWPELIAYMADTCIFMNLIPESSLLLCAGQKSWETLLKERLKAWKAAGREVFVFESAKTSKIPDVAAIIESIDRLSEGSLRHF